MKFLIRIALLVFAILAMGHFLPDVSVTNVKTAILVVVVLSLLNLLVKPVLILLTIPITIMTFGFFLLVINALLVLMADWLIDGFQIGSLITAFLFAIAFSIVNFIIDRLLDKE